MTTGIAGGFLNSNKFTSSSAETRIVKVKATSDGGFVEKEYTIDVLVPTDTTAPVINSVSYTPTAPKAGEQVTFSADVTENDSAYTVEFDLNNDGVFGDANPTTFSAADSYTVTAKATSQGGSATKDVTVTVAANPVILPTIDSFTYSGNANVGQELTLSATATNADSVVFDNNADGVYSAAENVVTFSTLGKKTVAAKAINTDGEDIHNLDIFVNGTGSITANPGVTVQHNHDADAEITATDATTGTYDSVKWYLDDILQTSTANNGSYGVNVDWVGIKTLKAELYSGVTKVGEASQMVTGENTAADHPECYEDAGLDDDYIAINKGDSITYYLQKSDLNNDSLNLSNLITNYGGISQSDVYISIFGNYYEIDIDTSNLTNSTSYFVKHKIVDPHGAESTEEVVTIRVN